MQVTRLNHMEEFKTKTYVQGKLNKKKCFDKR